MNKPYTLSTYQMQGIVKIKKGSKDILKISIGDAIYAILKHHEIIDCLKDILKHDGGAYDLEPRQSKRIMELIK